MAVVVSQGHVASERWRVLEYVVTSHWMVVGVIDVVIMGIRNHHPMCLRQVSSPPDGQSETDRPRYDLRVHSNDPRSCCPGFAIVMTAM
jgi:hypothetical protein